MIKLSERLNEIFCHVENCDSVADVGADHGKVAVKCALCGKSVVATDISAQSLSKTKELAESYGVDVKTVVCDGLGLVHSGEVEAVIIAGLGGIEIAKILNDAFSDRKRFKKYVLSPNTDAKVVRQALIENEIGIERDYTISDMGKFYPIIVGGGSYKPRDEFEIEFGIEYKTDETTKAAMESEYERLKPFKDKLSGETKSRFGLLEKIYET